MPVFTRPCIRQIRSHIDRFPEGAYRSEAADLLAARRLSCVQTWAPVVRQLPMYVSADGPAAHDEAGAKSRALVRARAEAERLCQGFGSGTLFRFVGATPRAQAWSCAATVGGAICGFDGHADCALLARQQVERDSCGPQ